jgi:hypothetical protein
MSRVVKYFKYKYLKYMQRALYFVFDVNSKKYFVFKYKINCIYVFQILINKLKNFCASFTTFIFVSYLGFKILCKVINGCRGLCTWLLFISTDRILKCWITYSLQVLQQMCIVIFFCKN